MIQNRFLINSLYLYRNFLIQSKSCTILYNFQPQYGHHEIACLWFMGEKLQIYTRMGENEGQQNLLLIFLQGSFIICLECADSILKCLIPCLDSWWVLNCLSDQACEICPCLLQSFPQSRVGIKERFYMVQSCIHHLLHSGVSLFSRFNNWVHYH